MAEIIGSTDLAARGETRLTYFTTTTTHHVVPADSTSDRTIYRLIPIIHTNCSKHVRTSHLDPPRTVADATPAITPDPGRAP